MVLVNLGVDAIAGDARDVCVKLLTYELTHILHHLVFYGVALSIGGNLLHVRGVLTQFLIVVLVGRACALGVACKQTVHHGVGIAAYRRCEVSVVVKGQSEVSYVMCRVLRLHHSLQRHHLYGVLLGPARHLVHQGIDGASRGSLRAC